MRQRDDLQAWTGPAAFAPGANFAGEGMREGCGRPPSPSSAWSTAVGLVLVGIADNQGWPDFLDSPIPGPTDRAGRRGHDRRGRGQRLPARKRPGVARGRAGGPDRPRQRAVARSSGSPLTTPPSDRRRRPGPRRRPPGAWWRPTRPASPRPGAGPPAAAPPHPPARDRPGRPGWAGPVAAGLAARGRPLRSGKVERSRKAPTRPASRRKARRPAETPPRGRKAPRRTGSGRARRASQRARAPEPPAGRPPATARPAGHDK